MADHLAHQVVEDYQAMKFEFPDEDIMTLDNCEEIVRTKYESTTLCLSFDDNKMKRYIIYMIHV